MDYTFRLPTWWNSFLPVINSTYDTSTDVTDITLLETLLSNSLSPTSLAINTTYNPDGTPKKIVYTDIEAAYSTFTNNLTLLAYDRKDGTNSISVGYDFWINNNDYNAADLIITENWSSQTNYKQYFSGLGGDDVIFTRGGQDIVRTGDGNDLVYSDRGIEGYENPTGSVSDIVSYSDAEEGIEVDLKNDLTIVEKSGFAESYDMLYDVDNIFGSSFDDEINVNNDTGTASNTIFGASGDDIIRANDGDDIIFGGDGQDSLHGKNGNDFIVGGAGRNFLFGGSGSDIFKVDSGWAHSSADAILDFRELEGDILDITEFTTSLNMTVTELVNNNYLVLTQSINTSKPAGSPESNFIQVSFDQDGSGTEYSAIALADLYYDSTDDGSNNMPDQTALLNFAENTIEVQTTNTILYVPVLGQSNAAYMNEYSDEYYIQEDPNNPGFTIDGEFAITTDPNTGNLVYTPTGDAETGISSLIDSLKAYTDFDEVHSWELNAGVDTRDGDSNYVELAIGGSTVNGYSKSDQYANSPYKVWWIPSDTGDGKPGEALLRAVDHMAARLIDLKTEGAVTTVVTWTQGESEVLRLGTLNSYLSGPSQIGLYPNATEGWDSYERAAMDLYKENTLAVFNYIRENLGTNINFHLGMTGQLDPVALLTKGDPNVEGTLAYRYVTGLNMLQTAQQELIAENDFIVNGVNYEDLEMFNDNDPSAEDIWHLSSESYEIVGERFAESIATSLGYQTNSITINIDGQNLVIDLTAATKDTSLNSYNDYIIPETFSGDFETSDNKDYVIGSTNNDKIIGLDDHDILYGMDGDDILAGRNGDDILIGGAGDDTFFGSRGQDHLFGGEGNDTFFIDQWAWTDIYNDAGLADIIYDYDESQDQIDISRLLDEAGYTGTDALADGALVLTQVQDDVIVSYDVDWNLSTSNLYDVVEIKDSSIIAVEQGII